MNKYRSHTAEKVLCGFCLSSIQRYGTLATQVSGNYTTLQSGLIDNLSMIYQAGTNRLATVTDNGHAEFKHLGFHQVAGTGATAHSYDASGNMTYDHSKGATIDYNHLNLPNTITFQNGQQIIYTYDANGTKLISTRKTNSTTTAEIQHYLSGIEYKQPVGTNNYRLEAIYHPEGDRLVSSSRRESSERFHSIRRELRPTGSQLERAIYNPSTTAIALRHELCIKDHLDDQPIPAQQDDVRQCVKGGNRESGWEANVGNFRIAEILQENHYYPFGMSMGGPWMNDAGANDKPYQYIGKELESFGGLGWNNYEFRNYDASVGRWVQPDPMTEKAPNINPYRMGFNNPINYIDLFGLYERTANGGWSTSDPNEISRLITMLQVENSLHGSTSMGQIDRFITEEYNGSGGRLSDGSVMLSEITAIGNGSNAKFSKTELHNMRSEISRFGNYGVNHNNFVSPWSFYSYRYYRERSYEGSFGGLTILGFAADLTSHTVFNNAYWIAVGGKYSGNIYSPKFYSNQYVSPTVRAASHRFSLGLNVVGKGISIYGAYGTVQNIQNGKLSPFGGTYMLTSDIIGIRGNIYGSAWSFGTALGMGIVESEMYFNAVHKNSRIW